MNPAAQTDSGAALAGLLRYIAEVRDRALTDVRTQSDQECRALLDAARSKARGQVRRALQDERRDADAQIGLARAAAQARLRRARQAFTTAALERVWSQIETALHRRWREAAARRSWVAMALDEAARHLPAGPWQCTHPAAWDPAESDAEIASLRARRPGVTLGFQARPDLVAGIRIASGPAELDASADALLRERSRVEGLWLAALERARASRPETGP